MTRTYTKIILTLVVLATTIGMAEAQYRTCTTNCYGSGQYRTCTTSCF